ncbi:MAG: hypothetical protein HFI89_01790 [Lachnospiraceae bacterium]|nr:hypothetical protein [Lachnospiraceae bacterium]
MKMDMTLNKEKLNDKELFERKKLPETSIHLDEWLRENALEFYEARAKQDFQESFRYLCENMEIELDDHRFVYFLDFHYRFYTQISNLTPAYKLILQEGLACRKYPKDGCSNDFCREYNAVLDGLILLSDRIIHCLEIEKPKYFQQKLQWFRRMKESGAESFEEAIQRILFLNQMLWQTGSRLVGLGRLDMLLYPYYIRDIKNGNLTKEQAEQILKDFIGRLHEHYWFKSNVLLGDTGQVMILGGSDQEGNYIRNDLTDMILKAVRELQLSDPKIVLRANKKIPGDLLESALLCMATGIGSPLLANDDVIIPRLLDFGVEKGDAYEYTTSACWEPLIGGKSSSMNNEERLVYVKPLYDLFMEERLNRFQTFEQLKQCYLRYLKREIMRVKRRLYERSYQKNTLYSVFIEGCRESKKDIVSGGAKYHNIGMTTVALGNVVNALLNIKKYVFEEHRYHLVDAKKICFYDYQGYPETEYILKVNEDQYGCDTDKVIELSNEILRFVTENTKEFRTRDNGKLKFGVSNPSYINEADNVPASFDGRRAGAPFIVHISNENVSSYTELIHFASSLDYKENRFNGNVVDLMVNPVFMEQNLRKFQEMILRGIEMGFFQLQMNVISSSVLIEAKQNPENFQNLIVRVWGFSAYFVELPENYQDVLIQRALQNEGKS